MAQNGVVGCSHDSLGTHESHFEKSNPNQKTPNLGENRTSKAKLTTFGAELDVGPVDKVAQNVENVPMVVARDPDSSARRARSRPARGAHSRPSGRLPALPTASRALPYPQETQTGVPTGRTYASATANRPILSAEERANRKSFDSVFGASTPSTIASRQPHMHRGEPAISILPDEESFLAAPFRFTLVGKFSRRKPPMHAIRSAFTQFGFVGSHTVGLIAGMHILIHLTHEVDYTRLFSRPRWFLCGCEMKVLKWTADFHPDKETPIVPVWISFPLLPVHFRAKDVLFSLAKVVGQPLQVDEATTDLLRPSEARVCVEVHMEHKLPERLWIDRGPDRSFWQPIVYEHLPAFCSSCRCLGHAAPQCKVSPPPVPPPESSGPSAAATPPPTSAPIIGPRSQPEKGPPVVSEPPRQWRPVQTQPATAPVGSSPPVLSDAPPVTAPLSSAPLPPLVCPPVQVHSINSDSDIGSDAELGSNVRDPLPACPVDPGVDICSEGILISPVAPGVVVSDAVSTSSVRELVTAPVGSSPLPISAAQPVTAPISTAAVPQSVCSPVQVQSVAFAPYIGFDAEMSFVARTPLEDPRPVVLPSAAPTMTVASPLPECQQNTEASVPSQSTSQSTSEPQIEKVGRRRPKKKSRAPQTQAVATSRMSTRNYFKALEESAARARDAD